MTDIRKWSAGAAVLAIAIFAAGWFLLVAPKHHATADLKAQAASQEAANALLLQKLQVLQAQQQDLPQQQAKLATLHTRIPDNPALPSLIRDLTAAGQKVGVSIDSMAPAAPVAVTAAANTLAPAAPAAPSTGTPAVSSTLFQVPLALQVTGSYFEIEQYLNKLEGLKRSLLITGFTLGAAQASSSTAPSAGSSGTPTVTSDLTVTLTGRVFLSQEAAPTTTTPVAAPATTTSAS
jgi:Tfp pilus assembly protein PilO